MYSYCLIAFDTHLRELSCVDVTSSELRTQNSNKGWVWKSSKGIESTYLSSNLLRKVNYPELYASMNKTDWSLLNNIADVDLSVELWVICWTFSNLYLNVILQYYITPTFWITLRRKWVCGTNFKKLTTCILYIKNFGQYHLWGSGMISHSP